METTECKLTAKIKPSTKASELSFAQVSVLVLIVAVSIFASPFVGFEKINNFFYKNA